MAALVDTRVVAAVAGTRVGRVREAAEAGRLAGEEPVVSVSVGF